MYAKRQFRIQIESITIYVLKQKTLLLGFQFFKHIRYLITRHFCHLEMIIMELFNNVFICCVSQVIFSRSIKVLTI